VTRRLFGTDGIRGVANTFPMTAEVALQLGRAIAHLSNRGDHRHRIVVGKDTRISGYMLEFAISSGVCSLGVDVILVGPMPTPAVAFLTKTLRCDAGIMISASHNPFQDNGIKFFGADGFKLADTIEVEIETLLESGRIDDIRPTATEIGKTVKMEDARGRYVQFVKSTFAAEQTLEGMKLVVDCAHGAAYRVAPMMLEELGATVIPVGVSPNGRNINEACGATDPARLQAAVREHGAHAGLALDGDADRLIVVDEDGEIVDGDAVMAMCGAELIQKQALPHATVVSTVMSNIGLERALERAGGKLVRTPVGDRYVVECMRAHGYRFDGGQSGHLIFLDHASTGDGCVAALQVLELMARTGRSLRELGARFERVPQQLVNVRVQSKPPLETLTETQALVAKIEAELGREGRVLVRWSGTENKARGMVQGPDPGRTKTYAETIASQLEAEVAAQARA